MQTRVYSRILHLVLQTPCVRQECLGRCVGRMVLTTVETFSELILGKPGRCEKTLSRLDSIVLY